jgi:hypothetical protein
MRPDFKVEWLKLEGPRSAETCLISTNLPNRYSFVLHCVYHCMGTEYSIHKYK